MQFWFLFSFQKSTKQASSDSLLLFGSHINTRFWDMHISSCFILGGKVLGTGTSGQGNGGAKFTIVSHLVLLFSTACSN